MKKTNDQIIFTIISYIVVGLFGLFTVLPFIMLVISSFTSEHYIINHGYTIIPKELSIDAYKIVFLNPKKILDAYGITIFVTVVGTLVSLFLSTMGAYVIYRKDVKYRNVLAFFIFFTTLFNGGLAPYYIIVSNMLKLRNTITILIIAWMFSAMYILILRSFIRGTVPDSLIESSKIDGAGDFRIFVQVVLPLCKAALASIGLFIALGYWNDWWTPMMFIEKPNLYPMQYVLYQILSSTNLAAQIVNNAPLTDVPKESLKLALTVISAGPIVFLYPFAQKYFVKGVTIGAVKG